MSKTMRKGKKNSRPLQPKRAPQHTPTDSQHQHKDNDLTERFRDFRVCFFKNRSIAIHRTSTNRLRSQDQHKKVMKQMERSVILREN